MEKSREHSTKTRCTAHPELLCSLCGFEGEFIRYHPDSSLRETKCPRCGASRRTRDVARVLLASAGAVENIPLCQQLHALEPLRIFELQAAGPLHTLLKNLPHYHCSEFFPSVPPGQRNQDGILCQDATCLTYHDKTFDIVISQDILEHIENTWHAFSEISRVLAENGTHIFTVPVREGTTTRRRACSANYRPVSCIQHPAFCHAASCHTTSPHTMSCTPDRNTIRTDHAHCEQTNSEHANSGKKHTVQQHTNQPAISLEKIHQRATHPRATNQQEKKPVDTDAGNAIHHILPAIYHGDPLNPEGALVWWDFGDDLVARLAEIHIPASLALRNTFYGPKELCKTDTPADQQRYALLRSQKQLSRFFLYNSLVFTAKRKSG